MEFQYLPELRLINDNSVFVAFRFSFLHAVYALGFALGAQTPARHRYTV